MQPWTAEGVAGVVTIHDDANFGNRLQAYALQEALRSLGWRPEFVANSPRPMSSRLLAARAWRALRSDGVVAFGRRNLRLLINKLRDDRPVKARYAEERRRAIAQFAADALVVSKVEYTAEDPVWKNRYEIGIVGSDQVWNPGFRNAHDIDFLTFLPESRRVAYAASFGVAEIPQFLRAKYASWLAGIPEISVREDRGAVIVKELIGRDVPVVVDPTLLLERSHWEEFAERPLTLGGDPYAVKFFLGRATKEQEAWVERCAKSRGVRLLDLNDLENEALADLDPRGFVGVLAGADFVSTDSFHAGVFSLIHHRPIIIRSRDETDSRLQTLFDLHGISRDQADVEGLTTALSPDWTEADRRLAAERRSSWQFLRDSVGRPGGGKCR